MEKQPLPKIPETGLRPIDILRDENEKYMKSH